MERKIALKQPLTLSIKNKIQDYKHAWVFLYYVVFMIWYFGLQNINKPICIDMYTKIDQMIPFISLFIYPYIYWYLFVGGTLFYFFLTNKRDFYRCCAFIFGGMTICLIIYTIFPTSFNHRPHIITGDTLSVYLTQFIYSIDKSQNVLPSIHVFNSIGCMIALLKSKKLKNKQWVKYIAVISMIVISMSTVFVKQHSILDGVAAVTLSFVLYYFIYKKDILSKYIKQKQDY